MNMVSGAPNTVALMGFKPVQRQVIQRILALSAERSHTYELVSGSELAAADFLLVDAEDLSAVDHWQANAPGRSGTSVFVGDYPVDDAQHQIKRAQLAGQLLNVLDEISENCQFGSVAGVAGAIGRPHILIIDDSLSARTQMAICLQEFNIDVTAVESAEEGVAIVGNGKIDLVFLDIMLPGMDGYEACGLLKKASNTALPVVLLTSKSSPFNKVRGVMAGCDKYLTKPAELRDLTKVIAHFLGDVVVRPAPAENMAVAN